MFGENGLKAWVTQASCDDGVDVSQRGPIIGGLCIIQAKHTRNNVPTEAVRALVGVMHGRAAAKGILITTAWLGKQPWLRPAHRPHGTHRQPRPQSTTPRTPRHGRPSRSVQSPGWQTRDVR
ncbi:restriction endonuclease [Streptomyces lunaelactis]|uniref:restriction endonuclease n=1 Tax=Streptomyces lunaelactis TaxID=1535768 RepID=UPI00131F04B1